MSPKLRLKTGAATHAGRTANENEDAYDLFVTRLQRRGLFGQGQPVQVAVVADGISGSRAGADASRLAVDTFRHFFQSNARFEKPIWECLNDAIMQANAEIYRESLNDAAKRGMGATVVAAAIEDDFLYVGHVGDSRAYLLRRGKVHQLTVDHTQVQELVAAGALSAEAAQIHPERFHLTRRLGRHDEIRADLSIVNVPSDKVEPTVKPQKVSSLRLEKGDTVLLCSDGLPMELSDDNIQEIIVRTRPVQSAAQRLVEQANAVGGRDNITAVLLHLPNRRSLVGAFLLMALAALVFAYYWTVVPPLTPPTTVNNPLASDVPELTVIALGPTTPLAPSTSTPSQASSTDTPSVETPIDAPTISGRGTQPTIVPQITVDIASAVTQPPVTVPPRATLAPSPTSVPTPIPSPPQAVPPAANNAAVVQQAVVPDGASVPADAQVELLGPDDGSFVNDGAAFTWQPNFALAANQAFELIFWRPGQDPLNDGLGCGGTSRNPQTAVDFRAVGTQCPPGQYIWGVRLVNVTPSYQKLRFLGGRRTVIVDFPREENLPSNDEVPPTDEPPARVPED